MEWEKIKESLQSMDEKDFERFVAILLQSLEGDIRRAIRTLPDLQVYVLAASRDTAQLRDTFDAVEEETGLDVITLELSDELSDLSALCVTFWEDIKDFSTFSKSSQQFLDWLQDEKQTPKTRTTIELETCGDFLHVSRQFPSLVGCGIISKGIGYILRGQMLIGQV